MSKDLLNTPRAVEQRHAARHNRDYIRLLEALETLIRGNFDPKSALTALDKFRS